MSSDVSDLPVRCSKGIGPRRAELLERIGIRTIRDALYYLPFRYEDRTSISKICNIRIGCVETVRGKVVSSTLKGPPRGMRIFSALINDGSGIVQAQWFNQPYMKKNFPIGREVLLSGQVKMEPRFRHGLTIDAPEYEFIDGGPESSAHTGRIVPIYRLTAGISIKQFRKIMFDIVSNYLDRLEDPVPGEIVRRNGLLPLRESIANLHFPEGFSEVALLNSGSSAYHRRLVFDELFLFELGMASLRLMRRHEKGTALRGDGRLRERLLQLLPFSLTASQEKVLGDILNDMGHPHPMHRLVQGDVGCGKTVVAVLAMLNAVECGYQAALMAPTEVLAVQHYRNIRRMTNGLGIGCTLLSAGTGQRHADGVESGRMKIVVGTHAIIQEGVKFRNLGLAVIDEQHKFGVTQRALLRRKGLNPDVIVMTATPIPRSLAMTLYGDLDYSVIGELPAGRRPVTTKIFDASEKAAIYEILGEQVRKGRQAYVVYPVIEESEKTDLRSAMRGKEGFQRVFPSFRVGLIHGRMDAEERDLIMDSFRKGAIDVLVATTVIEVGMDVPNATIMIIIHAERFGLAQLHQLRGRVGRGAAGSFCLLVAYGPLGADAARRLQIMAEISDGFRIAEEDLAIRGSGEFFGTRQSGMPDLRMADIVRDYHLLEAAKREAFHLMETDGPGKFPLLEKSFRTFWKRKAELVKTG
jgi:ATP-dependent DNA helicase RecG